MHPQQAHPPLIQTLLAPSRYPGKVQRVELLQTHISWVLLAGDFAYKIKKPLKLPFLDFSTLALRKRYCDDELRLNRRYAPDIYLDVVPICDSAQGPVIGGLGTPAIEYAVRMQRFDVAGQLDRLCNTGKLTAAHVSDLAEMLSAFHTAAAVAGPESRFGEPAQVLAPVRDNFRDLAQLLPGDADIQRRLQALSDWTEEQFSQLAPLITKRKAAGCIRECHGDLHLANMVLIDGRVRLFDCLEFNEDLRWIDVLSDHAFAFVDLLEHGQGGLANWFVDEVFSRSGDYAGAPLLLFYAVYRAMVRAKVAAIRAGQRDDDGNLDDARLGLSYAERLVAPNSPRLIITHGLAGCGKSTASTRLLQHDTQARTLRLRSDVERRRLFGLQRNQHSGSAINDGIYSADAHQRTYAHLQDTTAMLLRAGWSVIVDAAFLRRAERDDFHALATANGAGFAILAPRADTDELRRRITARWASGIDASEATLDVLDKQLQWVEPLGDDERSFVLAD